MWQKHCIVCVQFYCTTCLYCSHCDECATKISTYSIFVTHIRLDHRNARSSVQDSNPVATVLSFYFVYQIRQPVSFTYAASGWGARCTYVECFSINFTRYSMHAALALRSMPICDQHISRSACDGVHPAGDACAGNQSGLDRARIAIPEMTDSAPSASSKSALQGTLHWMRTGNYICRLQNPALILGLQNVAGYLLVQ